MAKVYGSILCVMLQGGTLTATAPVPGITVEPSYQRGYAPYMALPPPNATLATNMTRRQNDKRQSLTTSTSLDITPPQLEKMTTTLKKFELNFGRHMHILLDELNHFAATETVVLLGLCARLSNIHQGTEFREPGSKTGAVQISEIKVGQL